MDFTELHKNFEKKDTDLSKLQKEENFSRYILIRSLGTEHISALLNSFEIVPISKNQEKLYEQLFNSSIDNQVIISYIKTEYPKIRQKRKDEESHLPSILKDFDKVSCGIRNDNLNEESKKLVRNKSIASIYELNKSIDELLQNKIKGYLLWEYFNQATNDLIEHLFNDNENVIPTLRKITYVDFLMEIDGKIVPFDLKITHISDEYFNIFTKGLSETEDVDTFVIGSDISEIQKIKNYYKSIKSDYNLPNYGGLKKNEILEILMNIDNVSVKKTVEKFYEDRVKLIKALEENKKSIEWWNYKFQGERLFKNNNRFFVFLVYTDCFEDARPLKGEIDIISDKVNGRLAELKQGRFNKIKYYYEKDRNSKGAYETISASILVSSSCQCRK